MCWSIKAVWGRGGGMLFGEQLRSQDQRRSIFPLCVGKTDQSNGFQTLGSMGPNNTPKLPWGDWGRGHVGPQPPQKIRQTESWSLLCTGFYLTCIFEHRDLLPKKGKRERGPARERDWDWKPLGFAWIHFCKCYGFSGGAFYRRNPEC